MTKTTKEFFTIDEIAEQLKVNRTSVYPYLNLLKIERHKFPLDRKLYVASSDVEKIKQFKAKPWKIEQEDK